MAAPAGQGRRAAAAVAAADEHGSEPAAGCRQQHRGGDQVNDDLHGLLAVGTRLAYEGQWWQVTEMDGAHVLLTSQAGGVRRVSAGYLLADPGTRLQEAPGDPVEGTGADLAGLGEAELAEMRERVAH